MSPWKQAAAELFGGFFLRFPAIQSSWSADTNWRRWKGRNLKLNMLQNGHQIYFTTRHPLISIDSLSSDCSGNLAVGPAVIFEQRREEGYTREADFDRAVIRLRPFQKVASFWRQRGANCSNWQFQEVPGEAGIFHSKFWLFPTSAVIMQAFSATPHKNVKWVQEIAPTKRAG